MSLRGSSAAAVLSDHAGARGEASFVLSELGKRGACDLRLSHSTFSSLLACVSPGLLGIPCFSVGVYFEISSKVFDGALQSPFWLVRHGRLQEAEAALHTLRGFRRSVRTEELPNIRNSIQDYPQTTIFEQVEWN